MNLEDLYDIHADLEAGDVSIRDLHTLYERRQPVLERKSGKLAGAAKQIPWLQESASNARLFTRCALAKEEYLLVCEVAREALSHWEAKRDPDNNTDLVKVRINYAAALARLGFPHEARRQLEPCVSDDFPVRLGRGLKGEIYRQLGNIHKEESQEATSKAVKLHSANAALDFYKRALAIEPGDLETKVMIAGASLVLGLTEQAHAIAREALQIIEERHQTDGIGVKSTRWQAAAYAALGDIESATRAYAAMKEIKGVSPAELADARYSARFLAQALGQSRDLFDKAFPPLQLVVFVGHLPDRADNTGRFPHESVEQVRHNIRAKLDKMDVRVGLVSAAAGADLLFIDALLERKGTVHLVLPWSIEEFRKSSVRRYEREGEPPFWEPLFDRALKGAATVREIGEAYEPSSEMSWKFLMEVTAGLAVQIARVSRLELQPLALWDRQTGWKSGGTSSFVRFWHSELAQMPEIIDLPNAPPPDPRALSGTMASAMSSTRTEFSIMRQEVKSMLFADIVGYSRLPERVIPAFVETFLSRVSLLVAQSRHAPRSINTWGDAIYAIFDFARDAGSFALELTQMIQEGRDDWLKLGLYKEEIHGDNQKPVPIPVNVRIGLHTGPVFRHYDPVVRQLGFTGAQVSRAARIEPVANPGQVFASEEFAALAELDVEIGRRQQQGRERDIGAGFVCEFAGTMQLAKGYPGRHRIYRVLHKRVSSIEELARAVHDAYCEEARLRGDTPTANIAMRPWDELSEDLRDSNRGQVVDIPNKLLALGYELAPPTGLFPSEIKMTDEQVEELAKQEHDRWLNDRRARGWTHGAVRDDTRKFHPKLVGWDQLDEADKKKDRDAVRNMPRLIEKARLRVWKIAGAT
jgi:class 3 adenylate cyclase/tetratricopeptide (TPR) repeat protein